MNPFCTIVVSTNAFCPEFSLRGKHEPWRWQTILTDRQRQKTNPAVKLLNFAHKMCWCPDFVWSLTRCRQRCSYRCSKLLAHLEASRSESMRYVRSQVSITSLGVPTAEQPSCAATKASRLPSLRFHTTTFAPLLAKLEAIPWPMIPAKSGDASRMCQCATQGNSQYHTCHRLLKVEHRQPNLSQSMKYVFCVFGLDSKHELPLLFFSLAFQGVTEVTWTTTSTERVFVR